MIKSKQSLLLIPFTVLLTICAGVILYIVYIIVINNPIHLTDFNIITTILFLIWIGLFPLVMVLSLIRQFKFHDDKLEVDYIFGLVKRFYNYDSLRVSDYSWTTTGTLIELPDGDQMQLGQRQYSNYFEVRDALQSRIKKDEIKIKYTTRLTRTILLTGVILAALSIVAINLK